MNRATGQAERRRQGEPDPAGFVLTLRPVPDATDPDGIRRLRRALKCLLRSFGLRCVRLAPLHQRKDHE